ncbi:type IV pilus secretin PilQ [Desulfosarcina ovata]|uniref:Type II/III secretion system protein n=2 Tax=Desulfosarcina ovata TaxID=83564 RepID=A0A5K8A4I0_9BACT|nr:type IV pilus secretin PilQ [Desulfosarcina ovata]BBO80076.1 type II/III secretion system protein [Desulfosarcina ovata subsp. sediminis]BBO87391.1 type II/III secretion system protein [Desulfosarcina ovata subsp. ovata]
MLSKNRLCRIVSGLATLLLMATLCGCAGQETPPVKSDFERWQARAEEAKGYSPAEQHRVIDMPETPSPANRPLLSQAQPERPLPESPVTLKIYQTDTAVLLRALTRSVGISAIISDTVKGTSSLNVENIPWNQVFNGIVKTHGLSYTWEGQLLRIVTLEDKANLLKQLEADQKILSRQRELALAEPLLTKIIHVDYADAGKLKGNLEKFLSATDGGKILGSVLLDEHNNALIIQATRNDLERMIALVSELDQPTAQVLIEAHIVEATKTVGRELGIQWGGYYHWNRGSDSYGIAPSADAASDLDTSNMWTSNFPADVSDSGFSLGFFADTANATLAIQLSALEEEDKLNILSNPSITTLDNQTAIIESGAEIPFQTVEDSSTQIEYKKAVLRLEVTPHVIQGDTLKLSIKTNKDEPSDVSDSNGYPRINTKKAETTVVLYDGQTTVIGGLNKQSDNDGESGVPGLRKIPVLGYLFKGESKSREKEDLLIFITPHILKRRPAVQ